jgi:sulfite reductase beta subunit-like hemoprotein
MTGALGEPADPVDDRWINRPDQHLRRMYKVLVFGTNTGRLSHESHDVGFRALYKFTKAGCNGSNGLRFT